MNLSYNAIKIYLHYNTRLAFLLFAGLKEIYSVLKIVNNK